MKARPLYILLPVVLALVFVAASIFVSTRASSPTSDGLWITQITPTGGTGHPFDKLEIQFSASVLTGTFTISDVTFTGPGGPIAPLALTLLAADRFEIDFSGQSGLNSYALVIGSDILDLNNQPMDQDHDGVAGEAEDAYTGALFSAGVTINEGDTTHDGQN